MNNFRIWLYNLLLDWCAKLAMKIDWPEDPEPELPFWIDDMRESHPGMSDAELSETCYLTALEDTTFYVPDGDKRNEDGWMELVKAKDQEIKAGEVVYLYRWTITVNATKARETVYHPDGQQKMMVDFKKFSKPE